MGSRKTEEVQPKSGSTCWRGWSDAGCAPYPLYIHVWPGGSVGLETHLTFLVGVLVPVMVWFSCHGSVVPGIKDV